MDSRDRVPGRQEKRKLDYRGALTAKTLEHVNHGPGSGSLIDLSSTEGTPGRQNDAPTQGTETSTSNDAMKEFLAFQEARMDSFLQHSEEKVDAQRSALRQMTEHFAGIATNISNTVAHWLGHPAAHQGAHLYEELDLAHKRYIDTEGQYQELKIEYQNLQKQLQEANAKLAEAVEGRNELRKIADIANWTGATKVSDDTIRSKWKQLDYNIRAMARALAKCQTKCPTDNVNKARFESIVSSWPKLLENDDYKELLIAAYLWTLVNEEIFQHGDKFWGGGLIRGLKSIRAHLVEVAPDADRPSRSGPTMRHVAKWSAEGTALLSHFHGRDKRAPKRRASIGLDRLKQFCNIAAEKSGTDFLQEMKSIMETALDLDEMLMGSMAILSVYWPGTGQSKGLRYDADGMDAMAQTKELSPKTAVVFTISPMLLETGNANGCNYDSEMTLCKASVVCA